MADRGHQSQLRVPAGAFSEQQKQQIREAAAHSRLAAEAESEQRRAEAAQARHEQNDRQAERVQVARIHSRLALVPPPADTHTPPLTPDTPDDPILDTAEAQTVLARLRAAVGDINGIDVDQHVRRVAADAIRAKQQPRNPWAAPTLFPDHLNSERPGSQTHDGCASRGGEDTQ